MYRAFIPSELFRRIKIRCQWLDKALVQILSINNQSVVSKADRSKWKWFVLCWFIWCHWLGSSQNIRCRIWVCIKRFGLYTQTKFTLIHDLQIILFKSFHMHCHTTSLFKRPRCAYSHNLHIRQIHHSLHSHQVLPICCSLCQVQICFFPSRIQRAMTWCLRDCSPQLCECEQRRWPTTMRWEFWFA